MNKQIAFAYGIAGLAVAAALVAVVTTSTQTANDAAELSAPLAMTEPTYSSAPAEQPLVVAQATPTEALPPVEYVYVDEPAAANRRDHDDEDDRHEGESEGESEDDDRDRRGGHDDDDD